MNNVHRVLVVIPSFRPPKTFPEHCQKLLHLGLRDILIINDGSPSQFDLVFQECERGGARVLHLEINRGKGEALRSGMRFFLNENQWDSVVFCDDDGQHAPNDILKVAFKGVSENLPFVIGARDLNKMPFKSLVGNLVMTKLLRFQFGLVIPDTQSGLRFMSKDVVRLLQGLNSERFSFELMCLLNLYQMGYRIHTISIETIYFKDNKHTRFKALEDSINILKSLLWVGKE